MTTTYTYTTIDVPGARSTLTNGIDSAGDLVGYYNNTNGYTYDGSNFTTLQVPGSTVTEAFGMNDAGQVVGLFASIGSPIEGFMYDPQLGAYTVVIDPAGSTRVAGINNAGDMVGYYTVGTGGETMQTHGFLFSGGTYVTLDDPSAAPGKTEAMGIAPGSDQVVGLFFDTNDSGEIVGTYVDASGVRHGFTETTTVNLGNPDVVPGTTAEILSHTADGGQMNIYDVANGSLTAYTLQDHFHGGETTVAVGAFSGTDTADVIGRTADGNWYEHSVSGNNSISDTSLGQFGTGQILGSGHFDGLGTGIIERDASTGVMTEVDVKDGAVAGTHTVGTITGNWSAFGTIDVNSDGTTDLVLKNADNGQLQIDTIKNGVLNTSTSIGKFAGWDFFGSGQFDGNGGQDLLLHNGQTGAFEIVDIGLNKGGNVSGTNVVGQSLNLGGDWTFAGQQGSDVFAINKTTGAVDDIHVDANHVTATQIGALLSPTEHVDGVAAPDFTHFDASHSDFFAHV
jgi:hypothetical protein